MPERPEGCFAHKGTVPFFRSRALPKGTEFQKNTLAGNVPEKSVTNFFPGTCFEGAIAC
jgi:hypothetical protein